MFKSKSYLKKMLKIFFIGFIIYIVSNIEIRVPKEKLNSLDINLKTEKIYKKKCEKGDFSYCYELGSMYYFAKKTSINQEKAKKYLELSCNNKIANGCYILGIMYQNINLNRSKKYLEKSCLNGYGFACYQLGNNSSKEGIFSDKEYTKDMFKKGCLNGFYLGCYKYLLQLF